MTVRAVKLIRAIRDRNFEQIRSLPFEERLDFIRKKAAQAEVRLRETAKDTVEERERE